jgi:hypothetical protein
MTACTSHGLLPPGAVVVVVVVVVVIRTAQLVGCSRG